MKKSDKVKEWLNNQEKNCCCNSCSYNLDDDIEEYEKINECIDCIKRNLITFLEDMERIS